MRLHPPTLLHLATLACLVTIAPAALPAAGAPAPATETLAVTAATITVEGSSNVHDWTVAAPAMRGTLELPAGFLDGTAGAAAPAGTFTVAAKALRSDKDKMNELMWKALAAEAHPQLTFEMRGAKVAGGTVAVDGVLTVAGTARAVTVPFQVRRDGGRLVATGRVPLKMTWFGITPPTALMGTMKTKDDVVVTIEATLQPAS